MTVRKNADIDLSNTPGSFEILSSLYEATKGKGEGTVKCTITKHRVAKTAILLGIIVLSKKDPDTLQRLIERWAPLRKPGPKTLQRARAKTSLTLECSSTQGLLEGVSKLWRRVNGVVSHRRIMKACLCVGLDSLNRIESGKVRRLVAQLSPVKTKYWDPELNQWL